MTVRFIGCGALGAHTAECLEEHVLFSLGYLVGTSLSSLCGEALPEVFQRDGVASWGTKESKTTSKLWKDEGSTEVVC